MKNLLLSVLRTGWGVVFSVCGALALVADTCTVVMGAGFGSFPAWLWTATVTIGGATVVRANHPIPVRKVGAIVLVALMYCGAAFPLILAGGTGKALLMMFAGLVSAFRILRREFPAPQPSVALIFSKSEGPNPLVAQRENGLVRAADPPCSNLQKQPKESPGSPLFPVHLIGAGRGSKAAERARRGPLPLWAAGLAGATLLTAVAGGGWWFAGRIGVPGQSGVRSWAVALATKAASNIREPKATDACATRSATADGVSAVLASTDAEGLYAQGLHLAIGDTVAQDFALAAQYFQRAGQLGKDEAFVRLAWMSVRGWGTEADDNEAMAFLRLSFRGQNTERQVALACQFCDEFLKEREDRDIGEKQIAMWCQRLEDAGEEFIAEELRQLYLEPGRLLEAPDELLHDASAAYARGDFTEALQKFAAAAEQGHADAQFSLGVMYASGEGVAKSAREAVSWYRKAAEQGDADAQFNLAGMYAKAEEGTADAAEAVAWCHKAATQGHASAQFNLGCMYEQGERVAKSAIAAVSWYRKAAEQGHPKAQFNLSVMYAKGEGLPKNLLIGYKWCLLAKAGGNSSAARTLEMFESELPASQLQHGQALAAAFVPVSTRPPDADERRISILEREGPLPRGAENQPKDVSQGPLPRGASKKGPAIFSGTGFLIAGRGQVVTAAHVVANGKAIAGRLSNGRMISLRLVRTDKDLDLAVLQGNTAGDLPASLPIVSSRWLSLGQPVMTIGFPNTQVQGYEPKYTDGKISSLTGMADDPTTMQLSVPVQPGNSGGALVDMTGGVVGVVVSRLNAIVMAEKTGALSENVNYAVKSDHLLDFLERPPAAMVLGDADHNTAPLTTADPSTIQRVKDATVLIIVEE